MALPKNDDLIPQSPAADAPLSAWALWAGQLGRSTGAFKVFPCIPADKPPLHDAWQAEATTDAAKIAALWAADPRANIGLAIQPGFVAIDADLYKPGAEAELDKFESEHGELPRTLESRSARGGIHLIYCASKTFGNSRGTLPAFGDVRGYGGYIVGPGSVFEGKRYSVENLMPPVALPAKIESMLRETRRDRSKPAKLPEHVEWDWPPNVARFRHWLEHEARPSIEGERGNDTLAATAAMGASLALTEETTVQLLADVFNPRCQPPFDDEDLEKHGGSGYRSAENPGNMATFDTSLLFRESTRERQRLAAMKGALSLVPEPNKAANDGFLPFVSGTALANFPPVDWLVEPYIRAGIGLFWSMPKVGKTSLLAATAVAVKHEKPAWGVATSNPEGKRALFLATEDLDGAQRAIVASCRKLGIPISDCRVDLVDTRKTATPQISTAAGLERICQTMLANNQDLLIVDILALSATNVKLTEADAITQAFSLLAPLYERHGISVWLSTHSVKSGAQFFGAVQLLGAVYFDWELSREGKQIKARNHNMRGAAVVDSALCFTQEIIELAEVRDRKGRPASVMVPAFSGASAAGGASDEYAAHVEVAFEILCALDDPTITLLDLARETIRRMMPDIEASEQAKFAQLANNFRMYLRRLKPSNRLWHCTSEFGSDGKTPLKFRNPTANGKRAPKPSRRPHLSSDSAKGAA